MSLRGIASRAGVAAGWLALGISLLLASPGVRTARAEDPGEFERFVRFTGEGAAPDAAAAVAGEACQARSGVESRRAAIAWMREAQLRAAAQMRPGTPGVDLGNGVVLLNNRGYNYGPGPMVDAAQLEAELRLSR
jgi:hypothetical protein